MYLSTSGFGSDAGNWKKVNYADAVTLSVGKVSPSYNSIMRVRSARSGGSVAHDVSLPAGLLERALLFSVQLRTPVSGLTITATLALWDLDSMEKAFQQEYVGDKWQQFSVALDGLKFYEPEGVPVARRRVRAEIYLGSSGYDLEVRHPLLV